MPLPWTAKVRPSLGSPIKEDQALSLTGVCGMLAYLTCSAPLPTQVGTLRAHTSQAPLGAFPCDILDSWHGISYCRRVPLSIPLEQMPSAGHTFQTQSIITSLSSGERKREAGMECPAFRKVETNHIWKCRGLTWSIIRFPKGLSSVGFQASQEVSTLIMTWGVTPASLSKPMWPRSK